MGMWSEQIDEMLSQKSGSYLMCWSTSVLLLKSWHLWHTYWEAILLLFCSPVPTTVSPSRPFPRFQ